MQFITEYHMYIIVTLGIIYACISVYFKLKSSKTEDKQEIINNRIFARLSVIGKTYTKINHTIQILSDNINSDKIVYERLSRAYELGLELSESKDKNLIKLINKR